MRGQAMHKDGIRLSMCHKRLVHLIRLEDWRTLRSLMVKAHAGTFVGIDCISTCNCLDGIVEQCNAATGCLADFNCLVNNLKLWRKPFWCSDSAMCSKLCCRKHQRMTDVIAIAHISK